MQNVPSMMTRGNAELKARQAADCAWTGWKDKNVLKKSMVLSPKQNTTTKTKIMSLVRGEK